MDDSVGSSVGGIEAWGSTT